MKQLRRVRFRPNAAIPERRYLHRWGGRPRTLWIGVDEHATPADGN